MIKYIKENIIYFLIIISIFAISIFIGYYWHPEYLSQYFLDLFDKLTNEIEGKNFFEVFVYIFQNNLKTAFIGVVAGLFLGIYPVFSAFINAYVIGFLANLLSREISPLFFLLRLLPHGIFEIPALFLSLGLGLKLGISLVISYLKENKKKKYLPYIILTILFPPLFFCIILVSMFYNKNMKKTFFYNIENTLKIFLYIILPLLLVAGIIETILIFWI